MSLKTSTFCISFFLPIKVVIERVSEKILLSLRALYFVGECAASLKVQCGQGQYLLAFPNADGFFVHSNIEFQGDVELRFGVEFNIGLERLRKIGTHLPLVVNCKAKSVIALNGKMH